MSNIIEGKFKHVDELIMQLETKSKQAEDFLTQMKNFVGFLNERDDNVERVVSPAIAGLNQRVSDLDAQVRRQAARRKVFVACVHSGAAHRRGVRQAREA